MGKRSGILINNLLSEICTKTDIPKNQYKSWLIQEVGFTEEELNELEVNDLLPYPEN